MILTWRGWSYSGANRAKNYNFGDEVDKFLNEYISKFKTSKEAKITVRATQTLIYVSKPGHQIIGLISWVIKGDTIRTFYMCLWEEDTRRHLN